MRTSVVTALIFGLVPTHAWAEDGCMEVAASIYQDRINEAFANLQTRAGPYLKTSFSRFGEAASYQPQTPGWLVPFYVTNVNGSQARWFGIYTCSGYVEFSVER